jgi:hypothetical protein
MAQLKAIFLADAAGSPLLELPVSSNLVISDINAFSFIPLLLRMINLSWYSPLAALTCCLSTFGGDMIRPVGHAEKKEEGHD